MRRVAVLVFNDEHALLGAQVCSDAVTVVQYQRWRDLALRHASSLTMAAGNVG